METRIKENDMYALSKIGKDSVYSYIVTDKVYGWFIALATIGIQVGILIFFMNSAEASLQNNSTAVQFTWLCPRDTDVCKDTSNLTDFGWICFSVLMFAKLGKDFISGCKLIYHSAKITHSFKSRIRYFVGGTCLCSITLFALYVSCCCCVLSCSFRRSFLHLIGTMYFCVSSISGQYRLQQGYSDKQYSDHFNCSRRSIRHGVWQMDLFYIGSNQRRLDSTCSRFGRWKWNEETDSVSARGASILTRDSWEDARARVARSEGTDYVAAGGV